MLSSNSSLNVFFKIFFANISKMHYAGKNLHIAYIHPTHEKLKTHFGFNLAQFIKKLQA